MIAAYSFYSVGITLPPLPLSCPRDIAVFKALLSSLSGIPNEKPWLAVFVAWGGVDKCRGMWRRGTCVFGVEDLPTLITRRELFANKFYRDHQPLTLECLNAWIEMKTSCPSAHPLDYDYYKTLPFVHKE